VSHDRVRQCAAICSLWTRFTRFGRQAAICWLSAALIAGCGGGGGDDNQPPQPPPPQPNRAPVLSNANADQTAPRNRPLIYDASRGATTFVDLDGDPLTYTLTFQGPNLGLVLNGPVISGTPGALGQTEVLVTVNDGRGGSAQDTFLLEVVRTAAAPIVASANPDRLVAVGAAIDHDATQNETTFLDEDGDPLTFEVTLLSPPRGLSVQGTRVVGTFDSVGQVRVRVVARDNRDGTAEDIFWFAAPGPEPGEPILDPTFIYDDRQLQLPFLFRVSRENFGSPLPDTTPQNNVTTNSGAALGRVLFYDKRLSVTNTLSCGGCHVQALGFSTPDRVTTGFQGGQTLRNSMGLQNVRYSINNRFFWDQRADTLENQVLMPIEDAVELGNSLTLLEQKLAATSFYPALFNAAFGTPEITRDRMARALAQFMRSMISFQSKFDRAFHVFDPLAQPNPAAVLTAQELRGRDVFVGNRCSGCHFNDTHGSRAANNNGLDAVFTDPGAGGGRFRVASLRNIALTGPYMHDGRFQTLREVIEFYDSGVQFSLNLDGLLQNGSGGPLRLNLSEEDKQALEAFLHTLTDDAFLADPRFSDPFP
jgi:cytochrome c peroxidase